MSTAFQHSGSWGVTVCQGASCPAPRKGDIKGEALATGQRMREGPTLLAVAFSKTSTALPKAKAGKRKTKQESPGCEDRPGAQLSRST